MALNLKVTADTQSQRQTHTFGQKNRNMILAVRVLIYKSFTLIVCMRMYSFISSVNVDPWVFILIHMYCFLQRFTQPPWGNLLYIINILYVLFEWLTRNSKVMPSGNMHPIACVKVNSRHIFIVTNKGFISWLLNLKLIAVSESRRQIHTFGQLC